MDVVAAAALIVVASSLGLAGMRKAFDRAGAIAGATALGVPTSVAPLVGSALAPVELLLSFMLFVEPTTRVAAGGAFVLLALFTGMLAGSLARGERPTCHCFGDVSAAPISGWSVARNVGLMAACAVLLAVGPSSFAVPAAVAAAAIAVLRLTFAHG